MRLVQLVTLLIFVIGCSRRSSPKVAPAPDPNPQIVVLTADQVDREAERLLQLRPIDDNPVNLAVSETFKKFKTDQVHVVMAGTDSLDEGVDAWRTCAKLANHQIFGVPEDYAMVFYTVNNELCEGHPHDIVGLAVMVFPGDRIDPLHPPFVTPSYKHERLTLGVTTTTHFRN
ncbi:MAG: hypothetical protein AAB776_02080 [Patescibacteria group bacterium]